METTPEQDKRILSVHITLDHGKKKFTYDFSGEWRGRDVKYVMNHIFREYRGHMREIRKEEKEALITESPAPDQTGEALRFTLPPDEEKSEMAENVPKKRGRPKKKTEDNQ